MARRIAFKVSGVVQGVGFRDFTQRQANRLGLSGWVRNAAAHVEGEATGDDSSIDSFTVKLREGPMHAKARGSPSQTSRAQVDKLDITSDEQVESAPKGRFEVR